jgi:hypothetical protein
MIFAENQNCRHLPVTLIVATTLSRSIVDRDLSSSVGLDNLRGAYIAQLNANREQHQFCLQLLIANFGTKGVVQQTVPLVMQQIRLYAESHPDTFLGVVGFPFSVSVQAALTERSHISNNDMPIISPSAAADGFTQDPSAAVPVDFYTNFYRIVAPVRVEGQVLIDFMQHYSLQNLTPTAKTTILFEDKDDPYSNSLGNAAFGSLSGNANILSVYYTIGQPQSLDSGMSKVKQRCAPHPQQCNAQIFFAGYANDLNVLKDKLRAAGLLVPSSIRIIGGEGFYDLGSYNPGNYANLFFSMDASSRQINPYFPGSSIPLPPQQTCQNSSPFNCEFNALFPQAYPYASGAEGAGMHVLLTYDAIQAFIQVRTLAQENPVRPLWRALRPYWSDVKFEGVSGKIQFPTPVAGAVSNPVDKSLYIACTDSQGVLSILAEYVDTQPSLQPPTIFPNFSHNLRACLS